MVQNKPHKFKVGDIVTVRYPTNDELKSFSEWIFSYSNKSITEFKIGKLMHGYNSGNPYYLDSQSNDNSEADPWIPECLLSLKHIKQPKVKITIKGETIEVSESIAKLIAAEHL